MHHSCLRCWQRAARVAANHVPQIGVQESGGVSGRLVACVRPDYGGGMDGSVWNPAQADDVARRVVEANDYLTIATADTGGTPWATPVWFAADGLAQFFWVSRMTRRHSDNIEERPEVALAIFDSTTPVGEAEAVYVQAIAGRVDDADLGAALAVFGEKSLARGLRVWESADVTGEAPHRLYVARATEVFVLDPNEQRVRV
jgi:hypothetical protein